MDKAENLELFINSAKSLGHNLNGVLPKNYMNGNKPVILETLYQLMRDVMLNPITVVNDPSLMNLLVEGEEP